MEKKVWSKPKLVVLVRGKPEEGVLNGCKQADGIAVLPNSAYNGCATIPFAVIVIECADCETWVST